jgi:hypothetical protein
VNPRRTPQGIRGRHFANQSANVVWHGRTSDAVSALPRPEQTKAAAMPRDDCLGFDDMNRRPPILPGVGEPRPEETVRCREAKTLAAGSIHDAELVPKGDDFQVQRGTRLDDKSERNDQRNDDGRHECRLYRRTPATPIDATRTEFSATTGDSHHAGLDTRETFLS